MTVAVRPAGTIVQPDYLVVLDTILTNHLVRLGGKGRGAEIEVSEVDHIRHVIPNPAIVLLTPYKHNVVIDVGVLESDIRNNIVLVFQSDLDPKDLNLIITWWRSQHI